MTTDDNKPLEVLPFLEGGVIGDIGYRRDIDDPVVIAAGGWCAPSDFIYNVLPEQSVTIDLEDGGIYWTNAEFDAPLFVECAARFNGTEGVLGVPRGGLLPEMWELIPEITVTRGGPFYRPSVGLKPHTEYRCRVDGGEPFTAHTSSAWPPPYTAEPESFEQVEPDAGSH